MRLTLFLQSILFPLEQLLLLALIPSISFLFSFHLPYIFPPSLLSVIEFFIFLVLLSSALLFYSLIHFSHSLQSLHSPLSSTSPPLHHQSPPASQVLGQEINDGGESLAVSYFLLSEPNRCSQAVFSVWNCWGIIEMDVCIIQKQNIPIGNLIQNQLGLKITSYNLPFLKLHSRKFCERWSNGPVVTSWWTSS